MLKKIRPQPIFGYGGRAFDLQPRLRSEIAGTYLGDTLELALNAVKVLLKTRQKQAVQQA
jgi:hypothetical protein